MDIYGRYFSARDQNLINAVNNELKNNIIETLVVLFKVGPDQTNRNVYGEVKSTEGKTYYTGIPLYCHITREELATEDAGFGMDRNQNLQFAFLEDDLKSSGFYPELGDLILFNERYYEMSNVSNDKYLLGNQPNKNLSFVIDTHYTRLSHINVISRQV